MDKKKKILVYRGRIFLFFSFQNGARKVVCGGDFSFGFSLGVLLQASHKEFRFRKNANTRISLSEVVTRVLLRRNSGHIFRQETFQKDRNLK